MGGRRGGRAREGIGGRGRGVAAPNQHKGEINTRTHRDREAEVHHLRKVGTFAAERHLHRLVALTKEVTALRKKVAMIKAEFSVAGKW